jgi:hypothetical protein
MLDSKWLEILKESGWKLTAIAGACGLFLIAARRGWIPPLDPWMVQLAAFGLLLCGLLAVASLIAAAVKVLPIQRWVARWITTRREKRSLQNYIPYMTPKEREIVAYLLAKHQKTITAAADGGYAATLLSRGIIRIVAQQGQHLDAENVPMTVPDHLWDLLMEHKSQFPYSPKEGGHPWRVHWMVR